jgi:hypothetical protein
MFLSCLHWRHELKTLEMALERRHDRYYEVDLKIPEGVEQAHTLYFSAYEAIDRCSPPRSIAVFQIAGC